MCDSGNWGPGSSGKGNQSSQGGAEHREADSALQAGESVTRMVKASPGTWTLLQGSLLHEAKELAGVFTLLLCIGMTPQCHSQKSQKSYKTEAQYIPPSRSWEQVGVETKRCAY